MLAVNSSEIQPARTGVSGSASAARPAAGPAAGARGLVAGAACWPGSLATSLTGAPPARSAEALTFTAVGRHRASRSVVLDQVVLVEPLGQLARLGVPQPHPVPPPQCGGRGPAHRSLHLARALGAGQLQPGRQIRLWAPGGAGWARGGGGARE